MGLLQIDDVALRDPRFDLLGELTGKGKFDARGRVENLWYDCIERTQDIRTAEEIDTITGWLEDGRSFAELLVKCRLAEIVDQTTTRQNQTDTIQTEANTGYRIKGVSERMEWLVALRTKRAAAGVRGGKSRAGQAKRGKNGQFSPDKRQTRTRQNQTKPGGIGIGIGIVTGNEIQKQELKADADASPPLPGLSNTSLFIAAYVKAYKNRYGPKARPAIEGKEVGQISQYLADKNIERAIGLATTYCGMDDPWFKTKAHDLGTFLNNQTKIALVLDTGQDPSAPKRPKTITEILAEDQNRGVIR